MKSDGKNVPDEFSRWYVPPSGPGCTHPPTITHIIERTGSGTICAKQGNPSPRVQYMPRGRESAASRGMRGYNNELICLRIGMIKRRVRRNCAAGKNGRQTTVRKCKDRLGIISRSKRTLHFRTWVIESLLQAEESVQLAAGAAFLHGKIQKRKKKNRAYRIVATPPSMAKSTDQHIMAVIKRPRSLRGYMVGTQSARTGDAGKLCPPDQGHNLLGPTRPN